jgi:colicin import membrane protein
MASQDDNRRPATLPPEPGKWPAIGLAVLMHVLLAIALIFGVSWNNSTPGPVQAELWTALPAPNNPQPDQPTPQPTPPEPVKPTPPPPPPPEPKVDQQQADIAIEQDKKRRAAEKQKLQDQLDQQKRQADKLAADKKAVADKKLADKAAADKAAADKAAADKAAADKKLAADKAAADKKTAADQKAAADRDRKLRDAFRSDTARAAGLEGGREGGTADRNQQGGTGGNDGYANLVRACVKAGVIYPGGDTTGKNPTAIFDVQLLPTGQQAGPPRLKQSSGVSAFDAAVENGIRRCDPFPRPPSGRFESTITVQYRMSD